MVKKLTSIIAVVLLMLVCSCSTQKEVQIVNGIVEKEHQFDTVYITETGEKFHKEDCICLRLNKKPIALQDAISAGYGNCRICFK